MDNTAKILVTGDFAPIYRLHGALQAPDVVERVLGRFRSFISEADIATVNLECPLTEYSLEPTLKTGPNLCGHPGSLAFLKAAGFKLLTLANNHIMDFGETGFKHTIGSIEKYQLDYCGIGENELCASGIKYYEINGLKLAFINVAENEWSSASSYSPGANGLDIIKMYISITTARKNADFVVIISHGGHEYYTLPSPRMKKLFRFFIDLGADAVINHHTHCISGFEEYKNRPIYYSIGNFLFDHPKKRNMEWNTGMAVMLMLGPKGIGHRYITFEQCNEEAKLQVHDEKKRLEIEQHLANLNQIIQDDHELETAFSNYIDKISKQYNAYIEPFSNRYIRFLQSLGWLPRFLTPKKRRLLLNLSRCEAHRDVLLKILEE